MCMHIGLVNGGTYIIQSALKQASSGDQTAFCFYWILMNIQNVIIN